VLVYCSLSIDVVALRPLICDQISYYIWLNYSDCNTVTVGGDPSEVTPGVCHELLFYPPLGRQYVLGNIVM